MEDMSETQLQGHSGGVTLRSETAAVAQVCDVLSLFSLGLIPWKI